MSTQVEMVSRKLFEDGFSATNIKMYPGTDRETGAEQFAEQINKVLAQIKVGDYEIVNIEELDN